MTEHEEFDVEARPDEIKILSARMEEIALKLKPESLHYAIFRTQGYSKQMAIVMARKQARGKKLKQPSASAVELEKNVPEVAEYISIGMKLANLETQEVLFASAMDKRHILWEIVEKVMACKNRQWRTAVSAINELNKMDGDHEATENKFIFEDFDFKKSDPQEAAQAYRDMIAGGNK